MEPLITYDDFRKVDIRVGEILEVLDFERARNPSYKVRVNFGSEIGEKWSSVQAKLAYSREELLGRQVLAVVNFPPKNYRRIPIRGVDPRSRERRRQSVAFGTEPKTGSCRV